MRNVVYSAAMSLDGYIAGPKGESDWIMIDPELISAQFSRVSTQYFSAARPTRQRRPAVVAGCPV